MRESIKGRTNCFKKVLEGVGREGHVLTANELKI